MNLKNQRRKFKIEHQFEDNWEFQDQFEDNSEFQDQFEDQLKVKN